MVTAVSDRTSGKVITPGRLQQLNRRPTRFEPVGAAEFEAAMANPMWRLSHLYKIMIKGDDDDEVLVQTFKPNRAQRRLIKRLHTRNIILKARQLGFTTFICILWLDNTLFGVGDTRAGIIAHDKDSAEVIFRDKVKFAYDQLPEQLRTQFPLKRETKRELLFAHNNSSIRVATSMRSGTIHYLHVSEFGKMCARYPMRAAEVITGSIPAVPKSGLIFIESTAEGQEGKFYEMSQKAEASYLADKTLNAKEYEFHFFAWHEAPEYRMDPTGIVITERDHKYFNSLEAKLDITLDPEQRAWYCATRDQDFSGDQEQMWQEYPSTPAEAFQKSVEGTYFREQMATVRKQQRITTVPYEPSVPVNTYWDIGLNDEMAIWFHQRVGTQHRFIRYYEESGEAFEHFVQYMQTLGYVWGRHYLPHDGDTQRLGTVRNWTPRQMLEDLGLRNVEVVPRIDRKINAIHMTRQMFPSCWFDEVECKDGLVHLDLYRKQWDERLAVWKDEPRHDAHSNGADAFMQFAQAEHDGSGGRTTIRRTSRSDSWRVA